MKTWSRVAVLLPEPIRTVCLDGAGEKHDAEPCDEQEYSVHWRLRPCLSWTNWVGPKRDRFRIHARNGRAPARRRMAAMKSCDAAAQVGMSGVGRAAGIKGKFA